MSGYDKYVLGTAQLGMDYGINNPRGKVPGDEAFAILSLAVESGIDTLDTAHSYGDSEKIIGEFIRRFKKDLHVITKLPGCRYAQAPEMFQDSLKRLNAASVAGLLLHDFNQFKADPGLWGLLREWQRSGKVKQIGFSLYYPHELSELEKMQIDFDLLQVPYNIFDRRFESCLAGLRRRGVEIHARSLFLQGAVFLEPSALKGNLKKLSGKLNSLRKLSERTGIPVRALALNFGILNDHLTKVVFGVDSKQHLQCLLKTKEYLSATKEVLEELKTFQEDDEQVILPAHWR